MVGFLEQLKSRGVIVGCTLATEAEKRGFNPSENMSVWMLENPDMYKEVIKSTSKYPIIFAPENLNYPKASILGILGMEKVNSNESLDLDHFIPNYIRPSEAELNLFS